MKLRKIPFVEVEYLDSGTFQGGEEDCSDLQFDESDTFTHKEFVVIRKIDFRRLKKQLTYLENKVEFLNERKNIEN